MDVLGRDSAREVYRVAVAGPDGPLVGLVPEHLMAADRPLTGGSGHRTAYDWIARHSDKIEQTLRALRTGDTARVQIEGVVLEGE